MSINKLSVIGAGNMGGSIVKGIIKSGYLAASSICVADPREETRADFEKLGVSTTNDNKEAISQADMVIIAVKPYLVEKVMNDIKSGLSGKILVSIAAGVNLKQLTDYAGQDNLEIYRAIPNTAIAVQESMTCIATNTPGSLPVVQELFDKLGKTSVIAEDLMAAATVLASCGTAFALRYVRAAMLSGIEMGFPSGVAESMASQTLLGAAKILLETGNHPETEIDKVTTPKGITITGLNEMEHAGFSSSVIQGHMASFNKLT